MRDSTKAATSERADLHAGPENELTGWQPYKGFDNFEIHCGPYFYRQEPDGSFRAAFRVENKHLNDGKNVSGGCLMAFGDSCLFVIAKPVLQGPGVTIDFSGSFIDAAREGDLIVGAGEIIRAGGSLIFVRGQLTSGERTLFTFSGTIKRLKKG
ncbi:PaaI family thioesterase [Bradyrhizobium sp. WSM2793]|uniref:PaaI family thioesterase n=1 Tax=Bradyrhizobium sp. WSM2793 TaxID=1038866 RepID=UPI0003822B0C|nr:PaaI family thioesterase [Bradyrhizobium sp. WSM2793]